MLNNIDKENRRREFNIDESGYFYQMLCLQRDGKLDSWAIRWYASMFLRNGLAFHPGCSLVENLGFDGKTGKCIVAVDPRYFRPTEVETLLGDPTKAKEKLGWVPKITLKEMVQEMMEADLESAKRDALVKEHGFKVYDYHE